MAEETPPDAEAPSPDTERDGGGLIPLIFGLIAALSTAGLWLSLQKRSHRRWPLHSSYMPPDVKKGYTQKPNGGAVIPCPVGPPPHTVPPTTVTIYVEVALTNAVTKGDLVTFTPTYTYADSAGTHADNPLPPHVFHYRFPNFCVHQIPNVAWDWTSLTLTENVDLEYSDGTGDTFTFNETVF